MIAKFLNVYLKSITITLNLKLVHIVVDLTINKKNNWLELRRRKDFKNKNLNILG